MQDILIPSGNEAELLKQAADLGYTSALLVYDDNKKFFTRKATLDYICTTTKSTQKGVIEATPENVRKLVEHIKPAAIHSLEVHAPKDYIHQRGGLNHVLAKLMKKNNITYVLNFRQVLTSKNSSRSAILGRMIQNVKVCQKYAVPLRIASFAKTPMEIRSPEDLKSLFTILGMDTSNLRTAFSKILKIKN